MRKCIESFRGNNHFLSNFELCQVNYDGLTYGSSEAAFQAQKCTRLQDKIPFTHYSPATAKERGRMVMCIPHWDRVKDDVMYNVCLAKFRQNPELTENLRATGDALLVEGNSTLCEP